MDETLPTDRSGINGRRSRVPEPEVRGPPRRSIASFDAFVRLVRSFNGDIQPTVRSVTVK
jgi:hypothetical protein